MENLIEILKEHKNWLKDKKSGKRAVFMYHDLTDAVFTGADLSNVDFNNINLNNAQNIFQFGPMPTSGRIIYAVRHDSGFMVQAGCFWGNLEELKKEVENSHKCPFYLGIIELLKKMEK